MPRRRKKTFPCGHKGYGQVCHRCAQAKVLETQKEQVRAKKQREKREWEATFDNDPIDLRTLPPHVVTKARDIIAGLNDDRNYRDFGGKRLRHNRQIISIPITRNYRMICHDNGGVAIPQSVLSHEAYNVKKPGARSI
ncbi:DUF7682 family zinc-binding protein [Baaleninema sp.]|uniref:DUF7682 family zinc-binding protein n=1 Tax=Baaleninema sp. TaxID=3101197 RepID=UPI003CFE708B